MKIIKTEAQHLQTVAHREGVTTCPYCTYDSSRGLNRTSESWDARKRITYIILRPSMFYKSSSVIFISECPECSELSWQHAELDGLCGYVGKSCGFTEKDVATLKKEMVYRIRDATEKFHSSRCFTCTKLECVSMAYLHFYVSCPGRSGTPSDECDRFKKGKA